MSNQVEIEFTFEGKKDTIKVDLQEKIKDLKNKCLNKLGQQNLDVYFIYDGINIEEDKKLEEIIKKLDKEEGKMIILLSEANEGDDINYALLNSNKKSPDNSGEIEIEFNFEGNVITMRVDAQECFNGIKNEFLKKVNIQNLDVYFLYQGGNINMENKVKQLITEEDMKSRRMKMLVYKL